VSPEAFRIFWLVWFCAFVGAVLGLASSFLIGEILALANAQPGDTLTEVTRTVLAHPFSFWWCFYLAGLVVIVGVIGWLGPHMLGMGKIW